MNNSQMTPKAHKHMKICVSFLALEMQISSQRDIRYCLSEW